MRTRVNGWQRARHSVPAHLFPQLAQLGLAAQVPEDDANPPNIDLAD